MWLCGMLLVCGGGMEKGNVLGVGGSGVLDIYYLIWFKYVEGVDVWNVFVLFEFVSYLVIGVMGSVGCWNFEIMV